VDLKATLIQIGALTVGESVVRDTWPIDNAVAVWNYDWVREDHSKGMHDFKYATSLLESSIEAVEHYIAAHP
jgi:hypothetical protein